jgi:hypothetical protein
MLFFYASSKSRPDSSGYAACKKYKGLEHMGQWTKRKSAGCNQTTVHEASWAGDLVIQTIVLSVQSNNHHRSARRSVGIAAQALEKQRLVFESAGFERRGSLSLIDELDIVHKR